MDSLLQAEQFGRDARAGSPEAEAGQLASAAKDQLARELAWAEGALGALERGASERVSEQLAGAAGREKGLAADARALHDQSRDSSVPLPQTTLDRLRRAARAMDEAARLLAERQGARGAEQQEQAQRLLEQAVPDEAPNDAGERGQAGDGDRMAQDVEVPGEHRDARAARFRERVASGLRTTVPPPLREALRRYAEGLVR
jgi:hypothetical protein